MLGIKISHGKPRNCCQNSFVKLKKLVGLTSIKMIRCTYHISLILLLIGNSLRLSFLSRLWNYYCYNWFVNNNSPIFNQDDRIDITKDYCCFPLKEKAIAKRSISFHQGSSQLFGYKTYNKSYLCI